MADFPYCTVPGKLSEFLGKIHSIGIPDKVTTRWLPTIGFASANDRSIITVLKFVGLIDSSGVPTGAWRNYRGHASGKALGEAVETAYSELFKTYPDAPHRSADDLKAFFRGHSNYGAQAVAKAVSTFQALCQNAEFGGTPHRSATGPDQPEASKPPAPAHNNPLTCHTPASSEPSLHIDLQVHISPEVTPEQIDKIFESMAKHLYKRS